MAEKVRYSDEELEEFRALILEKLAKAKEEYQMLKGILTNSAGNNTDDTAPTFKAIEDGSASYSREEAEALAARQFKFITHLQAALQRIDNKTYGICRETGTLIPKERLRIVPHATLSVEAKQNKR